RDKLVTSEEETRVETLEQWLRARQYWEQWLWSVCSQSDQFGESDVDLCYKHMCRDVDIVEEEPPPRPTIAFEKIYLVAPAPTDTSVKVSLLGITEMRHV